MSTGCAGTHTRPHPCAGAVSRHWTQSRGETDKHLNPDELRTRSAGARGGLGRFSEDRVSAVKKEVGDVSILINNAGIVTGRKFLECPDELMEKSFDVNFKAHLWTYKAFLPAMIANDHGHLVCISSSAGLIGVHGLADYCASKFAAAGFAESMFAETIAQNQKGIKTTIVYPFFIKTGMFDGCSTSFPNLLPILEPEYVVRKIVDAILQNQLYLCIPKSLYFLLFLKSFLPVRTALMIARYLDIFHLMDGVMMKKDEKTSSTSDAIRYPNPT
ncbi:epidermal retinol dehydrogenase 2-like [Dugong dugon]